MPTGLDRLRDELRMVANIIESIPATDLWTMRSLSDGSGEGDASNDPMPQLRRVEDNVPIRRSDKDIRRRFQLETGGQDPWSSTGGTWAGQVQDTVVRWNLVIGYPVEGGNVYGGDWEQVAFAALQDMERVRQKLLHPSNRGAGTATNVTGGRTIRRVWFGSDIERDADRARLYAVGKFASEMRVDVENS